MPSKFLSGDVTTKFDMKVPSEIVDGLEEIKQSIDMTRNDVKTLAETTERSLNDTNNDMRNMFTFNGLRLTRCEHFLYCFVSLLDTLCRSKLFRFFNIFFKVYMIQKDNNHIIFISKTTDSVNPVKCDITAIRKSYQLFIENTINDDQFLNTQ